MRPIFTFLLLIALTSCAHAQKTGKKKVETRKNTNVNERELYVIDTTGAMVMWEPNSNSALKSELPYGAKVSVLGRDGDWVEINYEFDGYLDVQGYTASKSLGTINNFKGWIVNDLYGPHKSNIYGGFKLEFVSQKEFFKRKDKALDYFNLDSSFAKKANGVLELKLDNNQVKRLVDNEPSPKREYKYEGQFPQHYTVRVSSWEGSAVMLVEKSSGKRIWATIDQDDTGFPLVLEDNDHLLVFSSFSSGSSINSFRLSVTDSSKTFTNEDGTSIRAIHEIPFLNWNFAYRNEHCLCFWGKDGSLFFAIQRPNLNYMESSKYFTIPKKRQRKMRRQLGYVKLSLINRDN